MGKCFAALLLVAVAFALTGCAGLENKAFVAAGGVDAFKVETSGSTSTGTVLPNITAGGAVSVIATSPAMENGKTAAPVFGRSRRNSFFGSLFGVDCATEAMVYIGVPGESGEQTVQRLNALRGMQPAEKKTEDAAGDDKPAAPEPPAAVTTPAGGAQ